MSVAVNAPLTTLSGALPRLAEPSANVTLFPGASAPVAVTVAMSATDWPSAAGLGDVVRAVWVAS